MVTQQEGDPEMLWTEVLKIKKCHHPKHPVKEWLKISHYILATKLLLNR